MNKKVDISEVKNFSRDLEKASSDIQSQLDEVKESIEAIINMDSFSGKAAKEAKQYFSELHLTILASFQGLFADLEENLQQHIKTFESNVDHNDSATINSNYLQDVKEDINEVFEDLKKQDEIIHDTIKDVSDISSATVPSFSDVGEWEKKSVKRVKELNEDLDAFTSVGDETDVNQIMKQIETAMNKAKASEGKARFANFEGASEANHLVQLKAYNQAKAEAETDDLNQQTKDNNLDKNKQEFFKEMAENNDLADEEAEQLKAYLEKGDFKDEYRPENYAYPENEPPGIMNKRKVVGGNSPLSGRSDGLAGPAALTSNIVKGTAEGIWDAAYDTGEGMVNTVIHPIDTLSSLGSAVLHPVDTYGLMKDAISDSFTRDVINGDAETRSHWFSYALGTVGGSIVGTKGAGSLTKAGSTATKTAKDATRTITSKAGNVSISNPFLRGPQPQLATSGSMPYNVMDGKNIRDQMIQRFSSHFADSKKTRLKPNISYRAGEFNYLYKTDELGRIKEFSADQLQLTNREKRLRHNPNTPGKTIRDQAGHVVADRFGGSPDLDNLVSQLKEVNLGKYKRIEEQWAQAIKNGKQVSVDMKINYDGTNPRPSSFDVEFSIDGERYFEEIMN